MIGEFWRSPVWAECETPSPKNQVQGWPPTCSQIAQIVVIIKRNLARCRTTSWTEQTWAKLTVLIPIQQQQNVKQTTGLLMMTVQPVCQRGKDPVCIHTWISWSRLAQRWSGWMPRQRCSPEGFCRKKHLYRGNLIYLLRTASDEISLPWQSDLVVKKKWKLTKMKCQNEMKIEASLANLAVFCSFHSLVVCSVIKDKRWKPKRGELLQWKSIQRSLPFQIVIFHPAYESM